MNADPRHVAVIGATGRTGQPLLRELLNRGHTVTVLVRDPARFGPPDPAVRVVTGSSDDPSALAHLLQGVDTVISTLGPKDKDATLHRRTAAALIEAMHAAGVRRFIGVSGAGIDVPGDQKNLLNKVISFVIQRLGGAVVADKPAEHRAWASSDLDWTLVRPPRLTTAPGTGHLEHHHTRSTRSTSMSREDLAHFLVDVLEQHLYVRAAPFAATSRR